MLFLSSSALAGWGTEWDVGVLLPLLQCLGRCWCLPALAHCSPAEILPAACPGICPCSPLLPSHHSGSVLRGQPVRPGPSPATDFQLWVSEHGGSAAAARPRQVNTSCPPAKDKLCAKAGSDRDKVSFTEPFWHPSCFPFVPCTLPFPREV